MSSPAPGQVPTLTPPVDPATPPVATPPVDLATPPATPLAVTTPPEPQTYSQEYVTQLRNEAAAARVAKKAADDALADMQRATMTEQQRIAADLKNRDDVIIPALKSENQKLAVQVTASKMGIIDPELAALALDWKAIEGGKSVELALNELLALKPWLKSPAAPVAPAAPAAPSVTAPSSQSSPATPPSSATPASFTRSQIEKMSDDERAAKMADIDAAMESGRIDYTR